MSTPDKSPDWGRLLLTAIRSPSSAQYQFEIQFWSFSSNFILYYYYDYLQFIVNAKRCCDAECCELCIAFHSSNIQHRVWNEFPSKNKRNFFFSKLRVARKMFNSFYAIIITFSCSRKMLFDGNEKTTWLQ